MNIPEIKRAAEAVIKAHERPLLKESLFGATKWLNEAVGHNYPATVLELIELLEEGAKLIDVVASPLGIDGENHMAAVKQSRAHLAALRNAGVE